MNRLARVSRWAVFAGATCWGTFAADEKPAAPREEPAQDSISAAKRDFDTIKSTRDEQLGGKRALPGMSVPELSAAPSTPGPWAPAKPGQPAPKSRNWLLEAMEKKPDGRGTEKGDRKESELLRGSKGLEVDREKGELSESARAEDTADRERKPNTVANPFARFLGDWMSRQDYALLKPGMEKAADLNGKIPGAGLLAPTEFGAGTEALARDANLSLMPTIGPVNPSAAPRENPYLQNLNPLPAAPTAGLAVAPPNVNAPQRTGSPAVYAPAPEPVQAKPRVPDFVKPANDEKYFKQLKRF